LDSFGFQFFVDDIKSGIGLGLFGPLSSDPGPNLKDQCFSSLKKTRLKSASLEPLIGLLAFVVRKLWP